MRHVIARGPAGGVYLTFDDGPDPAATPEILSILKAFDCRATFFVLGENVGKYPSLLRAAIDQGHTVGIHGWDHSSWLLKPAREITSDLQRNAGTIGEVAPYLPRLVRPPFGRIGSGALKAVREMELTLVLWSICPDDWRPQAAEDITRKCLTGLQDGDIILLHDSGKGAANTLAALPDIIKGIREMGLTPKAL
jgi:peptidoglycan/xylan/chitin deacetylase (PgdA/CDA1 family)